MTYAGYNCWVEYWFIKCIFLLVYYVYFNFLQDGYVLRQIFMIIIIIIITITIIIIIIIIFK